MPTSDDRQFFSHYDVAVTIYDRMAFRNELDWPLVDIC